MSQRNQPTQISAEETDRQAVKLRVSGMTCTGCANSIQRALEARNEVKSASVSFVAGTAEIEGHRLQPSQLIEEIQARGFEAELIEDLDLIDDSSQIERQQRANELTWRYRAIVGLALWIPLELAHWITSAAHWHGRWMLWTMFLGSFAIIAFAGSAFYRSAWKAAKKGTTNMDTLISLGATTAFLYSTIVMFLRLDLPTYFAEASGLLGIVSLGHWFEARASARASSAVRELLRLQPETTEVQAPDGSTRQVASAEVERGWRMVIRPGGRIAVDGIVMEGESAVDQAIVTGETIPVEKRPGDRVVAGSMNTLGRLIVEASVDGRHTTIARIAQLVQKAQTSRAPIQRLADQVSSVFVPSVLLIAFLTLFAWWWLADDLAKGIVSAVTVLIISCPCALGLATPMAVMVGTGAASQRGILIRDAASLERIGRALRVVFDKTGTLTQGKPMVTQLSPAEGWTEESLLQLAASVEAPSEHVIAKAIVQEASQRGLSLLPIQRFQALPGRGVQAEIDRYSIVIERDQQTTSRISRDGQSIGTLSIRDRLRPDARLAIEQLKKLGMQVSILTGDRRAEAVSIAKELNVSETDVVAEATPESKVAYLRSLGKDVIMVGDGINDAAALAESGLGVAMASGTVVAIEAAAVVIPGDRVRAIPELIDLSRATLQTIRQNLFFAFFYNALAIPIAAFGLLGSSGPLWAAILMGISDVTVVGNALRLKNKLAVASLERFTDEFL